MFEELFKYPSVIARYKDAPYADERTRYLKHCAQNGYARSTLLALARDLLWVARKLNVYAGVGVTLEQIKRAANGWTERQRCCGQTLNTKWTRDRFIDVARPWLRFLGRLRVPIERTPFASLMDSYCVWMKEERGQALTTIDLHRRSVRQFLRWYGSRRRAFSAVHIRDIDAFLAAYGAKGNSRVAVKSMATTLRAFFRYAGRNQWCRSSIAEAIQAPRVFAEETLPSGPSWHDVRRLFASMKTNQPRDIRDRAIVMLFAIYGLRASEVANLRIEDIDWERDRILIRRLKRREAQIYPLVPTVGNAISRYLEKVRPPCDRREVFLAFTAPIRPISRAGLYHVVGDRMLALGINTPHRGPHSLRHACATHLVSEGFSLKEIGDHLGHRSTSATRIYAKVDLSGLREVATFDLGGVI